MPIVEAVHYKYQNNDTFDIVRRLYIAIFLIHVGSVKFSQEWG